VMALLNFIFIYLSIRLVSKMPKLKKPFSAVRMAQVLSQFSVNHSHLGVLSTTRTTRFTMMMIFLMFLIWANIKKLIFNHHTPSKKNLKN
jgi:hypothetical protein